MIVISLVGMTPNRHYTHYVTVSETGDDGTPILSVCIECGARFIETEDLEENPHDGPEYSPEHSARSSGDVLER